MVSLPHVPPAVMWHPISQRTCHLSPPVNFSGTPAPASNSNRAHISPSGQAQPPSTHQRQAAANQLQGVIKKAANRGAVGYAACGSKIKHLFLDVDREVINTIQEKGRPGVCRIRIKQIRQNRRTRARTTRRPKTSYNSRHPPASKQNHLHKNIYTPTMFTPHTRRRSFAPPAFLAPSTFLAPRPKLSLCITSSETCTRYSPSKIPACEFLSPATQRNTRYNACIESSESESSGDEAQEVKAAPRSGRRRRAGTVRFEEVVSVRIIETESKEVEWWLNM